ELAGRNYVHKHNVPSPFQPVIKKWQRNKKGTQIELEIRIVDNNFLEAVLKRLEHTEYFILGSTEFELVQYEAHYDTCINLDSYIQPLPSIFNIQFNSPTLFSRQEVTERGIVYKKIQEINLKLLLHSICKYLQVRFNYKTDFDTVDAIAKKTIVIHEYFEPINIKATSSYQTDRALHGEMTLKIKSLNKEERDLLGKLLKLSTYIGVGNKKAFG